MLYLQYLIIYFHLFNYIASIYIGCSHLLPLIVLFHRYDMWSVGVVILEMILGSPNVFQISPLTHTLLDQRLEGWNDDLKDLAYK